MARTSARASRKPAVPCSACPYWEVVSTDAASLVARLPFGDHEDLLRGFPFPHDLEMAVSVEPEVGDAAEKALSIDADCAAAYHVIGVA